MKAWWLQDAIPSWICSRSSSALVNKIEGVGGVGVAGGIVKLEIGKGYG
jgi:hypothetical protein